MPRSRRSRHPRHEEGGDCCFLTMVALLTLIVLSVGTAAVCWYLGLINFGFGKKENEGGNHNASGGEKPEKANDNKESVTPVSPHKVNDFVYYVTIVDARAEKTMEPVKVTKVNGGTPPTYTIVRFIMDPQKGLKIEKPFDDVSHTKTSDGKTTTLMTDAEVKKKFPGTSTTAKAAFEQSVAAAKTVAKLANAEVKFKKGDIVWVTDVDGNSFLGKVLNVMMGKFFTVMGAVAKVETDDNSYKASCLQQATEAQKTEHKPDAW
jgi:hypothetical protein